MKKVFKKILKFLGFSRERHYLKELINNIENVYKEQRKISYSIYQIRQRGFIVKVGGLFAFVSFKHMPWRYPNYKYWNVAAKYLVGKRFYCTIHKVKRKPLLILVDAKTHLFKDVEFDPLEEYKALILNKSKYGYIVDVGLDFHWDNGSFLGLINPSNISEDSQKLDEGDEITVRLGKSNPKREIENLDFIDANIPIEWYNGEIKNLIGTVQEVSVILNTSNRREYVVNEKYKAYTPATKELYGDEKDDVEERLKDMEINKKIPCSVVSINRETKRLVLKIFLEDIKA